MKKNSLAVLISVILLTASCARVEETLKAPPGPGKTVGGAAGAVIGVAAMSGFGAGTGALAMKVIGAGAGALLGSEVGSKLDESDIFMIESATDTALKKGDGEAVRFHNPETGLMGEVAASTAEASHNTRCASFTQDVTIDGAREFATGFACHDAKANMWVIK